MTTIRQKTLVLGLGAVLAAGALGFDWADTLFPSAGAHGVDEQPQSNFVRIENETFSRQILQTGDVLTVQGQLVSLVERDLQGWVSILSESANAGNRWEVISKDPPDTVFDIPGNSVVPYSVSARALEEGVYHVHTQLNVASVGPGLGPGLTVVVEGEPVEGGPVTVPAPPDSAATAAPMPPGGASDDLPMFQIDLEVEASALAEGYDLRQIANISGHLPDLVVTHEILARDAGVTSISVLYAPHTGDSELLDHVALVIQLLDSNTAADYVVPLLEALLSDTTLDMVQGWIESDGFAEAAGLAGGFDVTHWTTDTLDAAGLGDEAFSYTFGGSVEGQEFDAQQIWFSRDRLVIFVSTSGLSEEATMAVAAEVDSRVMAQTVRPEPSPDETPTAPTTPLLQDGSSGADAGGKIPAFISVGAGERHTCGVRGDGTVECWGDDEYGQATPPDGTFASVSVGYEHACGVRDDGTVECWGSNQRRDGLFVDQATPPDGTFASVSAGHEHTCGVRADGAVECWGSREHGLARPPEGAFASVSSGDRHACGVGNDGTVACWGSGWQDPAVTPPGGAFQSVSAGYEYTCGVRGDGTVACWGSGWHSPAVTPPGGAFLSVSAGHEYACGVRGDGTVECWGDDEYGRAAPPPGTFDSVSVGYDHACGVRGDGTAECWGNERFGKTRTPDQPAPTPETTRSGERLGQFTSVSAGIVHSCGVGADGSAICWGYNDWPRYFTGQARPPGGSFASIDAGDSHTCGVRDDGAVECWGENRQGQATPLGFSFTSVSAGHDHTCGVRDDGTVECWGSNENEYGSFTGQATPPPGTFASVSAGLEYTCGVMDDGRLRCWGSNTDSYGVANYKATPPPGTFASVSAGDRHACGVRDDGAVECWGSNENDYGSFAGQATPPEGTFASVSAGRDHTCGVRDDGAVECWGSNEDWYGSFAGQATPPDGTFASVSAGYLHTCGVETGGAVVCWGSHGYGQATPPDVPPVVDAAHDDHANTGRGSTPATAGKLGVGTLNYERDVDFFVFEAEKGMIYRMGVLGALPDAALVLYDADVRPLASRDSSAYGLMQSIAWKAPQTERYHLSVAGTSGGTGSYVLFITAYAGADDYPNTVRGAGPIPVDEAVQGTLEYHGDVDVFAFSIDEDDPYRIAVIPETLTNPVVTLYGADGEELASGDGQRHPPASLIRWDARTANEYYVEVTGEGAGSYTLAILRDVDDVHGNLLEEASSVVIRDTVEGALDYAGDVDFFAFEAEAGESHFISIRTESDLTGLATTIYGPGGHSSSAASFGSGGISHTVFLEHEISGRYYIGVDGSSDNATGAYTLYIAPVAGPPPLSFTAVLSPPPTR